MERSDSRPSAGAVARLAAGESAAANAQARRPDPDYLLLGQRVRVHLQGGQEVVGQLTGLSRYCLVVVAPRGRLVIYKHSVNWLVSEGTENGR